MSTPPHHGEDGSARPEGLPAALASALRDTAREVAATRASSSTISIADGRNRVLPTQLVIEPTAAQASTDEAAAAVLDILRGE